MVVIKNRIKGSTMVESVFAFTLTLLALGLGLTIITQIQSQQYLKSSNALYVLKKVHSENKVNSINKKIEDEFELENYIIERSVKKGSYQTLYYHYDVKTKGGDLILKYDFIEQK